jgi:FixJ family two-component response regulator
MPKNSKPPATETANIVIVDNDTAVLSSLKFSLELEGFIVSTYRTGAELLEDGAMPSAGCLVIDYHMPGSNGLDLLEELRARHVTLPAILITGHPNAAIRRRAAAAGVPIVEKPFLGNALNDSIRMALGNSPKAS